MKYFYIFIFLGFLFFFGAGCAGPQATIENFVLGKADAPVQIVEYFDYQCPACKVSEDAVVRFIIEDYVNTGKAAITFKNAAFIGPESKTTAMASLCAQEQEKFLDYHKGLFEAQGAENSGVFTNAKLKSIAKDAGLDAALFAACLDSQKYRDWVARKKKEMAAAGIDSTPTYIINGQKILGGTYLSIKRVIDKKLEEAGKK